MMYHPFIQPPSLVRSLYPKRLWRMDASERSLYLTFDDGPHPTITPFVLSQLDYFNAKASFFCIGNRVAEYPFIFEKILDFRIFFTSSPTLKWIISPIRVRDLPRE